MNIFVTGGTGFLGGHFVNRALANNHKIYFFKRPGKISRVKINGEVMRIEGELDKISLKNFRNIDVVVHFASPGVSPQKASWNELHYFNVISLLSLLKECANNNIKKIIIAGSYLEYGLSANLYKYIPTIAALRPTNAYAASKAAGFDLAHGFCVSNKIPLIYNRIFSAYGDYQYEKNFWPSLKKASLNGENFRMTTGNQIRDFISVDRVMNEFINSVEKENPCYSSPLIKNICTGKGKSLLEFASFWWSKWESKGELLPGTIPFRENEIKRFVGKKT